MLLGAVNAGVGLLTWENESFAYADSYDEDAKPYRGLRGALHPLTRRGDVGVAFDRGDSLGAPELLLSMLSSPVRPRPCQRFTCRLTATGA